MRNLSFAANHRCIIEVHVQMEVGSPRFVILEDLIILAMGATRRALTPSEQEVLDGFREWVHQLRVTEFRYPKNGAYVYFNCNTGKNLVFIATLGYGEYAVSYT